MLACYYPQGKQLASGVIGLLTCQSHYNVSVINTTPCARLFLRHLLDQRILTCTCERPVSCLGSCHSCMAHPIHSSLSPVILRPSLHLQLISSLVPQYLYLSTFTCSLPDWLVSFALLRFVPLFCPISLL